MFAVWHFQVPWQSHVLAHVFKMMGKQLILLYVSSGRAKVIA
jgi:hypothetical protein